MVGLLACSILVGCSENGPLAELGVTLPAALAMAEIPVEASLEGVTDLPATELSLVEVSGESRTPVAFQIEDAVPRMIHWIVDPTTSERRTYELVEGVPDTGEATMHAVEETDVLVLRSGDRDLLGYHFGVMPAPEGQNPLYQRSGFIHPLRSPRGQVLTRIQPEDHYHHYGIWNPWTQVEFEGRVVDFWNLASGQGTVRFAGFVARDEGPVFTGYTVKHEHVVMAGLVEKVALNELQTVRLYQSATPDVYIADVIIEMECATDSPFLILEYSYAGLGWRATGEWNNDNSQVLTSDGKTRADADGTTARWYMIQGDVEGDHAGVVMMSHPDNLNHPEPLRIWPPNMPEGAVFAMFAPTKTTDWLLEPGQTYVLEYRMVVFNGEFDAARADREWLAFGEPPQITIKK